MMLSSKSAQSCNVLALTAAAPAAEALATRVAFRAVAMAYREVQYRTPHQSSRYVRHTIDDYNESFEVLPEAPYGMASRLPSPQRVAVQLYAFAAQLAPRQTRIRPLLSRIDTYSNTTVLRLVEQAIGVPEHTLARLTLARSAKDYVVDVTDYLVASTDNGSELEPYVEYLLLNSYRDCVKRALYQSVSRGLDVLQAHLLQTHLITLTDVLASIDRRENALARQLELEDRY